MATLHLPFCTTNKANLHGNSKRPSTRARLTVEALEARTLLASSVIAAPVVPAPAAPGLAEAVKVEPPPPRPLDTVGLIAVPDVAAVAQGSTLEAPRDAATLAGSFAWMPGLHEAYEFQQALREMKQLAELRH